MSDFSCYITITNQSPHTLTCSYVADSGTWREDPGQIAPNDTANAWLKDPSGVAEGSEGSFLITIEGTAASLTSSFQDGYVQHNYARASMTGNAPPTMKWSFRGASGSPGNWVENNVPSDGHPVYLEYTFVDTAPPAELGAAQAKGQPAGE